MYTFVLVADDCGESHVRAHRRALADGCIPRRVRGAVLHRHVIGDKEPASALTDDTAAHLHRALAVRALYRAELNPVAAVIAPDTELAEPEPATERARWQPPLLRANAPDNGRPGPMDSRVEQVQWGTADPLA